MSATNVLLVHYDPRQLDRFAHLLQESGFSVNTARDGASAVTSLMETEPELILIEAMLPTVSGFEVCADLKKTRRGQRTPVVLMTALYKGHKYRTEALHTYGADEYIELPVEDAALVSTLNRVLEKHRGNLSGVQASS